MTYPFLFRDKSGLLRALYLNASSPSNIAGLNGTALFDPTQVAVSADAGDEGGVIYDSAVSLTQGMWPATSAYNTTLANGTTVVGPLSGYQVRACGLAAATTVVWERALTAW